MDYKKLKPEQKKIYDALPTSSQLLAERLFSVVNEISDIEEQLGGLARMTSELEVLNIRRNLSASRDYLNDNLYKKYLLPKLEELAQKQEEARQQEELKTRADKINF